jgi:hypothetical protein
MADWSMKCVLIFVCDVCCTSKQSTARWWRCTAICVIPWKQADMVHGYQEWQDMLAPSMCTAEDVWHTDVFSCWCCQRATRSLGSAQNCLGSAGLQRSVCKLGAKENHSWWQLIVWDFLVSIGHVTLIKEGSSGTETWLITQIQKPEKGCVIENLSAPSSKESENIVISKDDLGKLSWDHKHVFMLDFLDECDTVGWVSLWYT